MTGVVVLVILLCTVAAGIPSGSTGPNKDKKAFTLSEKCLHDLDDFPDEPVTPALQTSQLQPPVVLESAINQTEKRVTKLKMELIPLFVRKVFSKPNIFTNGAINKLIPPGTKHKLVKPAEKHEIASIFDVEKRIPKATFALFSYWKGRPAITANEYPNKFHRDPDLEKYEQACKATYEKSGYNCGHLIPRQLLNYEKDVLDIISSFAFVVPQAPKFNQVNWKMAENKLMTTLKQLTPPVGKQACLIITITSDIAISLNKNGLDFDYKQQPMQVLVGPTGQVSIPNSMMQIAFYPIIDSTTGKLKEVKYLAYFGNNSDEPSKVLTSFVSLGEIAKWLGVQAFMNDQLGISFKQVVIPGL